MSEPEVTWSCRFHPFEGFHEVGCPHQEWTIDQLQDALICKKKFEQDMLKKAQEGKCPFCGK